MSYIKLLLNTILVAGITSNCVNATSFDDNNSATVANSVIKNNSVYYSNNLYKTHRWKLSSYLVDKNIYYAKEAFGNFEDNWWAWEAINGKGNFVDAIKNLKTLITWVCDWKSDNAIKYANKTRRGIMSVLDGDTSIDSPFENWNKTEAGSKAMGLLTGIVVATVLDEYYHHEEKKRRSIDDIVSACLDDAMNDDKFNSYYKKILSHFGYDSNDSKSYQQAYDKLLELLIHDANCYLNQFGVINSLQSKVGGSYRMSVFTYINNSHNDMHNIVRDFTEYNVDPKSTDDLCSAAEGVLENIESNQSFTSFIDKAMKKIVEVQSKEIDRLATKLESSCKNEDDVNSLRKQFTSTCTKSLYDNKYVRIAHNWQGIKYFVDTGELQCDGDIFDLTLRHLDTFIKNIHDSQNSRFFIPWSVHDTESRWIDMLLETLKYMHNQKIDESWWNEYLTRLKSMSTIVKKLTSAQGFDSDIIYLWMKSCTDLLSMNEHKHVNFQSFKDLFKAENVNNLEAQFGVTVKSNNRDSSIIDNEDDYDLWFTCDEDKSVGLYRVFILWLISEVFGINRTKENTNWVKIVQKCQELVTPSDCFLKTGDMISIITEIINECNLQQPSI